MLRLRVAELMRVRGLSALALSKGSGLAYATAYRVSRSSAGFGRLDVNTLNRLCEYFCVQPGELIEWVPDVEELEKRGAQ
jgi:DNA-binding Xre family transcriptional regulator